MDEVQLMIQGKVEDWRVQRMAAYKIVEGHRVSKDMPSIYEFISLPFDDEARKREEEEMNEMVSEAQRIYQQAVDSGYFNEN